MSRIVHSMLLSPNRCGQSLRYFFTNRMTLTAIATAVCTTLGLELYPATAVNITLSQPNSGAVGAISGQGFTPADGSPSSASNTYYLQSFTFFAGILANPNPVFLAIYPASQAPFSSGFIGSSTNSLTVSGGLGNPLIFTFDNLALNQNTQYAAILRTASGEGNITGRFLQGSNSDQYLAGVTYNSSGVPFTSAAGDARFSVTFSDTPVTGVPFNFNSVPGLLILGGFYGLGKLRQRVKKKLDKSES